jgi:hypothetical protein
MARIFFSIGWILGAALLGTPAFAQFGSIFREEPPRPPADVPSQPPSNYPPRPDNYPGRPRSDVPPAQPLPAPMSLPPASRPGAGSIEAVPLAPLPGTEVTPRPPAQQAPAAGQPGQQALPGLPPGVRQPRGAPPQPADTSPRPGDEVVVEPPQQRIANPTAVFSGLDKITGRIISFDVAIDETVQFGALQVTPRVCYARPPTETPNTDAFVEVDEVTLQSDIKRIFTGWMFAASPGLHAVEHPIYDVWLTDCKGGKNPNVAEAPSDQPAAAGPPKQPARAQPQRQPPRAQPPQGFLPPFR